MITELEDVSGAPAGAEAVHQYPTKQTIDDDWALKAHYWTKAELAGVFIKTDEMVTDFWLEANKISTVATTYSRQDLIDTFQTKAAIGLDSVNDGLYAKKSLHMTKAEIAATFVTIEDAKALYFKELKDYVKIDTLRDTVEEVRLAILEWCVLFICW